MIIGIVRAIAGILFATTAPAVAGTCGSTEHHCFELGAPACSDATCCALVCASDPTCCSSAWDENCVAQALALCVTTPCVVGCPAGSSLEIDPCGSAANSGCDAPSGSGSNCCFAHSTPDCDDAACLNAVCSQDPFCCMVTWDQICADLALQLCPELCAPTAPQFMPLPLGVLLCGSVAAVDGVRDHDWFAITIEARSEVTITLLSKTPIEIGVAENDGIPDCVIVSGFFPFATSKPCEQLTLTACLEPGTHWIALQSVLDDGINCNALDSRYQLKATVTGTRCELPDPINETCATATLITEGSTPVSTMHGTTDGPPVPESCVGFGSTTVERDVWFRFDATRSGVLRATTCGTTTFDARLVAYEGTCDALSLLDCDDGESGCPQFDPRVHIPTVAGSSYFLRFGGRLPNEGTAVLTLSYLPCEQPYRVDLIPLAPGYEDAAGTAINNRGDVVGQMDAETFRWSERTGTELITPLAEPIGEYAELFDINNAGVAVGYRHTGPGASRVPDTEYLPLSQPAGCAEVDDIAFAINDAGVIVGINQFGNCSQRGLRWVNGIGEILPVPSGAKFALAINASGQIAGFGTQGFMSKGWFLDGRQFTWIDAPEGTKQLEVVSLSDNGVVFGDYELSGPGNVHALFLWQAGTFTTIPLPAPFSSARAIARSEDGTILCEIRAPIGEYLAVWSPGGVPRALNDIIDPLHDGSVTAARDINASRSIAGQVGAGQSGVAVRLTRRAPNADLSCDGVVNASDLALLLGAWGPCIDNDACAADIDASGLVDAADLALVLGSWSVTP